jgi:hypothetical protein
MNRSLVFPSVGDDQKRDNVVGRILWAVILVLFAVLVLEVIFQFIIAPNLLIRNITVESEIAVTREAVLELAGIGNTEYYFGLDAERVKTRLLANSLVRDAVIEKEFPETLKIRIYGRKPVAAVLIQNGEMTIPAMIDENGVVFNIGRAESAMNLPVISGISFKDFNEGMVMPKRIKGLFAEVGALAKSFPGIYDIISEINIVSLGETDHELLVYMVPYSNRIRLGSQLSGNELKYAIMVLDVLKQQGTHNKISEIDFRTSEIVYNYKGGEIN